VNIGEQDAALEPLLHPFAHWKATEITSQNCTGSAHAPQRGESIFGRTINVEMRTQLRRQLLPLRPKTDGNREGRANGSSHDASSSFQNISVGVESDLLGLAREHRVHGACAVAADGDLTNAQHSTAKIGKDGDKHGKVIVNFAPGDRHVEPHFAFGWSQLIVEFVTPLAEPCPRRIRR